jgi:dolichol-phosphate mannosyltransferase
MQEHALRSSSDVGLAPLKMDKTLARVVPSPPDISMGNRLLRKDTIVRRLSSRIANSVRRGLLHDDTPGTGCGIKLLHRQTFLALPAFNHMHRFLPALFLRVGVRVTSVAVRRRLSGRSKYGSGNRLLVGIVDLFGVRWLIRRAPLSTKDTEA